VIVTQLAPVASRVLLFPHYLQTTGFGIVSTASQSPIVVATQLIPLFVASVQSERAKLG